MRTITIILAAAALVPRPAHAFVDEVMVAVMTPGSIVIDGSSEDWYDAEYPAVSLGKNETVYGGSERKGDEDYSLDVFLAYDASHLYVAMAVTDDRQVRTKKPGYEEDHVEILIDVPPWGPGDRRAIEFFPERKFPTFHPALRLTSGTKTTKIKGAKFTMTTGATSWDAEMSIPLASIPGLESALVASRWAIVAVDSDTKEGTPVRETVLATAGTYNADTFSQDVVETTAVALENVKGVMGEFLKDVKISADSVKLDYVDMAMGKELELLAKGGPFIGVMGPGFMSGSSYAYIKLPVVDGSDVLALEAKDVTGDSKADLVIRYREKNNLGSRVVLAVYAFIASEIQKVLAQEIEISQKDKSIGCKAELLPDGPGGSMMVLVTPGKAKGWTESSYKNVPEYGTGPVLPPWDPAGRKLWIYSGLEYKLSEADKIDSYLSPKPVKKKGKKK